MQHCFLLHQTRPPKRSKDDPKKAKMGPSVPSASRKAAPFLSSLWDEIRLFKFSLPTLDNGWHSVCFWKVLQPSCCHMRAICQMSSWLVKFSLNSYIKCLRGISCCQNGFPHCIEEIHSLLDSSPMFNRLKPNTSLVLWDSQAWSFYFPFWEALHPFYFYLYFYFYFTFPFGEHFIPFPAETFGAFL